MALLPAERVAAAAGEFDFLPPDPERNVRWMMVSSCLKNPGCCRSRHDSLRALYVARCDDFMNTELPASAGPTSTATSCELLVLPSLWPRFE